MNLGGARRNLQRVTAWDPLLGSQLGLPDSVSLWGQSSWEHILLMSRQAVTQEGF